MQTEENRYAAADRLKLGRPSASEIERVREAIRGQAFESAFAWDAAGNLVSARDGIADKAFLPWTEWSLLRDGVLLHNHPKESPFSAKDVARAKEFCLKRMELITKSAIYWIEPPPNGWSWISGAIWKNELKKLVSMQDKLAREYMQQLLSREELQSFLCDIMDVFRVETGIRYTRMERW